MPEGTDAQVPTTHLEPRPAASPFPEATPQPEAREREGLKVNFTINNKHLISHTLSHMGEHDFSSTEHQGDIVALQNFAWGVSQPYYDFVAGSLQPEHFFAQGGTLEDISAFLDKVEQSGEFGKVLEQAQAYLEKIKAEWEQKYPQTSQIIQELTGLDLNKQITVLITHPSLRNGNYLGNDMLAWGHNEDWPNYAEIYLWHEIMHSYLSEHENTLVDESLVQLIADNELRFRLNGDNPYPPFIGHDYTQTVMDKLFPYWQAYLQEVPEGGKRDILAFQAKLKAMPEFQETEEKPQQ